MHVSNLFSVFVIPETVLNALWSEDGSRYYHERSYNTGYAVTTLTEVVKKEPLPPSMSVQEAELKALTEACKLATDSIEGGHSVETGCV